MALRDCVLRIWDGPSCENALGTGFLAKGVDNRTYALTCAHVVNAILGYSRKELYRPDDPGPITITVESTNGQRLSAQLKQWVPPLPLNAQRPPVPSDIAVLSVDIAPASWPPLHVVPPERVVPNEQSRVDFTSYGCMRLGIGDAVDGTLRAVDLSCRFIAKASQSYGWFIEEGMSGAPISSDGSIIGMVAERFGDSSSEGSIIPAMHLAQAWPVLTNAYVGLQSFDVDTAHLFFGRGRPVSPDDKYGGVLKSLRERLEGRDRKPAQHIVAVVGASGSGKSSVLKAGLVPMLEREGWAVVSFRPQQDPLLSFAHAIAEKLGPGSPGHGRVEMARNWRAWLQENGGLTDLFRVLRDRKPVGILLVVDQFEELFGHDSSEAAAVKADVVLKRLNEAAKEPDVWVVFTLSPDKWDRIMRDPLAGPMLTDPFPPFPLPPLSPAEIGATIRGPAEQFHVGVDDGLAMQLASDTAGDEGRLPLLQVALRELWTQIVWQNGQWHMRHRPGADPFNLEAALARRAEEAIRALTQWPTLIDRQEVLRVLKAMIRVEGPDRRPTKRILEQSGLPEADRKILSCLAEQRLVVLGQVEERTTAELAHDALITHWKELSDWVDKHRLFLIWHNIFEQEHKLWVTHKLDDKYLLGAGDTARAVEWLNEDPPETLRPNDSQKSFIEAGRRQYQREQAKGLALDYASQVHKATGALFRIDEILASICSKIRSKEFDFVSIQLKDKDTHTIQSTYSEGFTDNWYNIARHSYLGPPRFWDIQAHIVAGYPPQIEVLSGWDDRFDEFIFRKFKHERLTRIFAPIIFSPTSEVLVDWRVGDEQTLNKLTSTPHDRRLMLRLSAADTERFSASKFEIIGTVEAGFYDPERVVTPEQAINLARAAQAHAPELHSASLEEILRVIAERAREMVNADSASLHFSYDSDQGRYAYEGRSGKVYLSTLNPRPGGFGVKALELWRDHKQRSLVVPDRDQGQNEDVLRSSFLEAYDEGLRAMAAIPILFDAEPVLDPDAPPPKEGLLYVRFFRTHSFTRDEVAWLEYFADRATDAIRQVTYYGNARDGRGRLANLHNIAQSLADNPSDLKLLDDIAGNVLNLFGASVVTVYEVDPRKEFVSKPGRAGRFRDPKKTAVEWLHEASAPRLLLDHDDNIYRANVRSSQIFCPSGPRDPALGDRFVDREEIVSAAGVILRAGHEIAGLMFVNFRSRHFFSREERRFIETLAATAAVAIRNRRMLSP